MPPTPYVLGVIPARGGSKGLPGKNLRTLGALSLIGHAVASCREAGRLTRFLVSTDSEAIAAEARRHGAEVPFMRPATLASDEAGMVPVLQPDQDHDDDQEWAGKNQHDGADEQIHPSLPKRRLHH